MRRLFCCIFFFALASGACSAGVDFAAAARLSMRGVMVKNPERLPGPEGYYRFYFGCMGLPVPVLWHGQWDLGDCTGRAVQAWIFTRRMTGDTQFGRDVENGQRAFLLSLLDPKTGMVTVPEKRDATTGGDYFHMWDQGRTLRALVRWWAAEKNPAQKKRIEAAIRRDIGGLDKLAVHGTDPTYGDYAVFKGDLCAGGKWQDDMSLMRGGQLLEPLAMYWQASRDPAAYKFARQVCAGVISGREADDYPDGIKHLWRFGADGSFTGHFHDHASIVLGVSKFGKALYRSGKRKEGLELLRWAKRAYDYTLSPANPNAAGSFGWFPENNDSGTQARQISEICCLADMIELAADLADASKLDSTLRDYDQLWDHVERYSVNTLLKNQFKVTPAYRALLRDLSDKRLISNGMLSFETDDQGTFDWEAAGHETLSDQSGGHLAQMLYAVQYDGQTASFVRDAGKTPAARNLKIVEPTRRVGASLFSRVETTDRALQIACRTTLGRGPYVVREFTIRNASDRNIASVRFACAGNLDFASWSKDVGLADERAGRVVVTPWSGGAAAAISGSPRPDYVNVDDAGALLARVDGFDWSRRRARMQGNPGGLLGWQLGSIGPGSDKQVRVILAVTRKRADLERAIAGKEFPGWNNATDLVSSYVAIARRMEGGFIACAYPNDLILKRDDGSTMMHWMGCCQYAGVRGLYAAWEPIFDESPGSLSVRMPLDRKGRLADQTVSQKNGRVVCNIRLRSACRVEVRIPDWAETSKAQAVSARAGHTQVLKPRVAGRWLQFGNLPSGRVLSVSYPLTERTMRERVGGNNKGESFCDPSQKIEYTVRWRGNQVLSISPAGVMPVGF